MDSFIKYERKWLSWSKRRNIYLYQTASNKWIKNFFPIFEGLATFRQNWLPSQDTNLSHESKSIYWWLFLRSKERAIRLYRNHSSTETLKIVIHHKKDDGAAIARPRTKNKPTNHNRSCREASKTAIFPIYRLSSQQDHEGSKIWEGSDSYEQYQATGRGRCRAVQ